jgi:hypothetical protein
MDTLDGYTEAAENVPPPFTTPEIVSLPTYDPSLSSTSKTWVIETRSTSLTARFDTHQLRLEGNTPDAAHTEASNDAILIILGSSRRDVSIGESSQDQMAARGWISQTSVNGPQ